MGLREELEREILFELSGDPVVLRKYQEGHAGATAEEMSMLFGTWIGALQQAIYRIAEVIDAAEIGPRDSS